ARARVVGIVRDVAVVVRVAVVPVAVLVEAVVPDLRGGGRVGVRVLVVALVVAVVAVAVLVVLVPVAVLIGAVVPDLVSTRVHTGGTEIGVVHERVIGRVEAIVAGRAVGTVVPGTVEAVAVLVEVVAAVAVLIDAVVPD